MVVVSDPRGSTTHLAHGPDVAGAAEGGGGGSRRHLGHPDRQQVDRDGEGGAGGHQTEAVHAGPLENGDSGHLGGARQGYRGGDGVGREGAGGGQLLGKGVTPGANDSKSKSKCNLN